MEHQSADCILVTVLKWVMQAEIYLWYEGLKWDFIIGAGHE
jgi:hypothetical protein